MRPVSSRCIRWPGINRASDGRPVIGKRYVYRIVWEQLHGRLRAGVVLHHTCGNVWCINPAHVEPMQQGQHLKQHGLSGDNHQRFKTRCPAGHEYSETNTYRWKGERHCRICRLATKRRFNAKSRL